MTSDPTSPRIRSISWGRIEVEDPDGTPRSYKDAKLFPGGSREWDWRETGTEHVPGIQPADVEELLEHGARVVVLSRGVHERLRVKPETLERLESAGTDVRVLQTEEAVDVYNDLREEDEASVGGLFHTTC